MKAPEKKKKSGGSGSILKLVGVVVQCDSIFAVLVAGL